MDFIINHISNPRSVMGIAFVSFLCGLSVAYAMDKKVLAIFTKKRNWRKAGEISEILLYPLKSGKAISLDHAKCTRRGLEGCSGSSKGLRDRFFMVIGNKNLDFKRGLTHPKMLLIEANSNGNGYVTFTAPGVKEITFKIPDTSSSEVVRTKMYHDEKVSGYDCGEFAAIWLSTYVLNQDSGLRLLYCNTSDEVPDRNIERDRKHEVEVYQTMSNNDVGAFSDVYSYSLMTEASMSRLRSSVPDETELIGKQFRTNFIVKGEMEPFEEDKWTWIKINGMEFCRGKPLTRCAFVNINPETAVPASNFEPLKTLKSFRCVTDKKMKKIEGDSPVFGIYMGIRSECGYVSVGDEVFVSET